MAKLGDELVGRQDVVAYRKAFKFELRGLKWRIHWPEDVLLITWQSRGTLGEITLASGMKIVDVPIEICKELDSHISNYRAQEG
jgi:hypothetical protein